MAAAPAPAASNKPGYNAEGKMVFSKFDFSTSGHGDGQPVAHNYALKKLTNVKGLKGYKNQLEFIEGKQRKLEELKVCRIRRRLQVIGSDQAPISIACPFSPTLPSDYEE